MTTPTTITIDLDLDQYLIRYRGMDHDGAPIETPQTLEDVIFELAAQCVADRVQRSETRDLSTTARAILTEHLHAAMGPIVEEALTQAVQRSNTWSEPKGEPLTLREVIVREAKMYLSTPQGTRSRSSFGRDGETPVQSFIREEVAKAVKADLTEAMDEARAQVREAVVGQASALLHDTLAKAAGVKA